MCVYASRSQNVYVCVRADDLIIFSEGTNLCGSVYLCFVCVFFLYVFSFNVCVCMYLSILNASTEKSAKFLPGGAIGLF